MEELFEHNMGLLNSITAESFEDLNKLYNLPYFDKKNLEKNKKNIKFILIDESDGKFFSENQSALYMNVDNSMCIKKSVLYSDVLNKDDLHTLLVHELIHMASSNTDKKKTGFAHKAFPITYNEGCTQYLTLKVLYGEDIDKALENNHFYRESTKFIKKIVDDIGEEKLFNGYFEANPRKSVDGFTPKELDKWTDTVMEMTRSREELLANNNIEQFKNNINETLEQSSIKHK